MAMSASLACSPTTTQVAVTGTTVTLTVNNSSGAAINVVAITPYVFTAGTRQRAAVAVGMPVLTQSNCSIPAAGSGTFTWVVRPHDPQGAGAAGGPVGGPNKQFDVGAEVRCANGTVIYPTVVTVTSNPSPHG